MTPNRGRALLVVGVLAAAFGLGACSHSAGSSDSSNASQNLPAEQDPAAKAAPDASARGTNSGSHAADAAGAAAGTSASGGNESGGSGGGSKAASTTSLRLPGHNVIRTAQLRVDVTHPRDVTGAADRAGVIAESVGGDVDSDTRTSGKHARADLVLRVPPGHLSPVLSRLSELGKERSREVATTDVTEKVADVTSRVTSAKAAISRLRAIYAGATKVSDVLAVEDDLSSREADLEALEAQQRALAKKTSMATISVSLRAATETAVPPKSTDRGGFLGGLDRGWHAFTSAASSTAAGLGAALPFVVLVLLLGVLARVSWIRRPNRSGRSSTPAPDPSA